MNLDHVRDGPEIYRRSFATIRAEANLSGVPRELEPVAVRIIHACGMVDVLDDLDYSVDFGASARDALRDGAPILVDALMVTYGIIGSRLPAGNDVVCTLAEHTAAGTTRSAAAVDRWLPRLQGAVVTIGNAPTALFRLLELLAEGAPMPAAIIGIPVGFVGAAESKRALAELEPRVPFLTVHGRRGGSAMAAAAVNALASTSE